MKLPKFVWIVLLMLAAFCSWLSIPPAPVPAIRMVEVSELSLRTFQDTSTTAFTGVFVDPRFLTALHALQQRAERETLNEPKVIVRSGLNSGQVNQIYSVEKSPFVITNR
jgi:hypothetical protein